MTTPKHPPVAYVEWVDTASMADLWEVREEVLARADELLSPIGAAGFLLADDARGIILALLYNEHADHIGHAVVIPRSAIKKMVVIRAGNGFTRETGPA